MMLYTMHTPTSYILATTRVEYILAGKLLIRFRVSFPDCQIARCEKWALLHPDIRRPPIQRKCD